MTSPSEPVVPALSIRVTDGPYEVTGGVPVVRRRIVTSEHGEPLTMQTTERLPVKQRVYLCRCGQSKSKPYCDSSHRTAGPDGTPFDGTETAPTSSYDERSRRMAGTHVVVRDDRSLCEHAGFCANRVSNVWEMLGHHGTDDSGTRATVISMVERCPSGALSYRLDPEGPDVEPELAQQIGVLDDGPLFVTGGVAVTGADGKPYEVRNRMTLCRCGASANKPFCDGSHQAAGFSDPA